MSFIRKLPAWSYLALAIVPVVLAGQALKEAPLPVQVAITLGIGLVFALLHWARADEAARSAHRWSWFWGSTWGLVAALAASAAIVATPALGEQLETMLRDDPRGPPVVLAFAAGVLFLAIAQAAGALVAWAGWWLSKR